MANTKSKQPRVVTSVGIPYGVHQKLERAVRLSKMKKGIFMACAIEEKADEVIAGHRHRSSAA